MAPGGRRRGGRDRTLHQPEDRRRELRPRGGARAPGVHERDLVPVTAHGRCSLPGREGRLLLHRRRLRVLLVPGADHERLGNPAGCRHSGSLGHGDRRLPAPEPVPAHGNRDADRRGTDGDRARPPARGERHPQHARRCQVAF
jgi:hypothetical protein